MLSQGGSMLSTNDVKNLDSVKKEMGCVEVEVEE